MPPARARRSTLSRLPLAGKKFWRRRSINSCFCFLISLNLLTRAASILPMRFREYPRERNPADSNEKPEGNCGRG